MPIWIRRMIFWSFALLFLVIAPTLVLYTAGFRYNFASGMISRTGVLSITTQPRNAQIFIDGQSINAKTPEVVKRIMPGTYTLALQKDGHHSWNQGVKIESGKTTTIQNVILFLDEEPRRLFNKEIETVAANPANDVIAYQVREGGWQEIWLFDAQQNTHTLLDQRIDEGHVMELHWSALGKYLLAKNTDTEFVALFTTQGERLTFSPGIEGGYAWHPSSDSLLSITTETGLYDYHVEQRTTDVVSQDDLTSLRLDASILRLNQTGSYTEVAQYIAGEKQTLALLPRAEYTIEHRDGLYLVLTDHMNGLYVLELHAQEPILLQETATDFDWNDDTDSLVFTDGFELSVYHAREHITELITRQGSRIHSVHWHPNAHSIFIFDTALRAFERTQKAQQRQVTTLLDETGIEEVWISERGTDIFFYGQKNGAYGLWRLPISRDEIAFILR